MNWECLPVCLAALALSNRRQCPSELIYIREKEDMKSDLAFFRAYADKQKCNVDDPDPAGQACKEARPLTVTAY